MVLNAPTFCLCLQMVRSYLKKKEGGRTNYSDSQVMQNAYNAVLGGQMSSNQAAKQFGVDKKALLRRVRGEIPVDAHVGRQTVLTSEQERELAECIVLVAEWGWGFTKPEVKDLIQKYCVVNDVENPFRDARPGYDWMGAFLKRHPTIVPRKTEQLSSSRARAQDPYIVAEWFHLLETELNKAGVADRPEQIFNVDESGFVTDPKSDVVLAKRGSRRVNQAIGGSGREQVTVNCGGSAAGQVLPPYVIYKGKNLYFEWTQGGPNNASYTTSEKGWMEGAQFQDWFQRVFIKETAHLGHHPRILIFDGHASHLTFALVEEAKRNNVVLLRLPAHLTHLLQPFDKSVFRPVKQYWQQLLREYARTHNGPVSKNAFPKMLKRLYDKQFTAEQVTSGFKTCGIFPLDRSVVPYADLQPTPFMVLATLQPQPANQEAVPAPPAPGVPAQHPVPPAPGVPAPPALGVPAQHPVPPAPGVPALPVGLLGVPAQDQAGPPQTVRDFFLKSLQPRFSGTNGTTRGRSARIQRFRYGESLTSDDCFQRMREEAEKKASAASRGRGRGRGRGQSRLSNKSRSPQPSTSRRSPSPSTSRRSPSPSTSRRSPSPFESDDTPCKGCDQPGGENWISCDLCDSWYHMQCVGLHCSPEEMEDEDWMCDDCTQ